MNSTIYGGFRVSLALLMGLIFATIPSISNAEPTLRLPNGSKLDLSAACPVCGMTVGGDLRGGVTYSYSGDQLVGFAGVAAVVFKDGKVAGFEGARCLFVFNALPKRYGIDANQVAHRYVTAFDTKQVIDSRKAYFVLGSAVRGTMGKELIPFSSKEKAERFKVRYKGKRVTEPQALQLKDLDRKKKLRIKK